MAPANPSSLSKILESNQASRVLQTRWAPCLYLRRKLKESNPQAFTPGTVFKTAYAPLRASFLSPRLPRITNPPAMIVATSRTGLCIHLAIFNHVVPVGIEPTTPRLRVGCCCHLSYETKLATYTAQDRRHELNLTIRIPPRASTNSASPYASVLTCDACSCTHPRF